MYPPSLFSVSLNQINTVYLRAAPVVLPSQVKSVRLVRDKESDTFKGNPCSIVMPRCACASEVYGSVFVCLSV